MSVPPLPPDLPTGVIARTRSHEPWFGGYVLQPNDGKFSVARPGWRG